MKTSLIVLCVALMLGGCGIAGNYNPRVDTGDINTFWKSNNREIGYLYKLFAKSNTFTEVELESLNQSRYTIMAVIENLETLRIAGGVNYQDLKSGFQLASSNYYKMMPVLTEEIKLHSVEAQIIFDNMSGRADYFIAQCNKIIVGSEKEIESVGWDNLKMYAEGFYGAIAPLVDMAL